MRLPGPDLVEGHQDNTVPACYPGPGPRPGPGPGPGFTCGPGPHPDPGFTMDPGKGPGPAWFPQTRPAEPEVRLPVSIGLCRQCSRFYRPEVGPARFATPASLHILPLNFSCLHISSTIALSSHLHTVFPAGRSGL